MQILFLKNCFILNYVCVSMFGYEHVGTWKLKQVIVCPGTGVTGSCESLNVGAGNSTPVCKSSHVSNGCAISLAPYANTLEQYLFYSISWSYRYTNWPAALYSGWLPEHRAGRVGGFQPQPAFHCLSLGVLGPQAKKQLSRRLET